MQRSLRAVIMRGGTSRAVFFRSEELPDDPEIRNRVILSAFGSPDPYGRQTDGLGGATSLTSKAAIIGPGENGVDVTYTFGQVGIDKPLVDMRGNCGNISSAVGPYAIDEGLVSPEDEITPVRFLNTNTSKVIVAHVPTRDGRFDPEGEYEIPGIPGTGSRIVLDYLDPGGAVTGKLLPTGRVRDVLEVPGLGPVEVSIVDAGNPLVFCRFESLGLTGDEDPGEIDADEGLLHRIESARAAAAVAAGLAQSPEEATRDVPSVPKMAMVTERKAYRQIDGRPRETGEIDLLAKMMSMGRVHRAYALTGGICTVVAAGIPGTLVHEAVAERESDTIRIGHPSGIFDVAAQVERDGDTWRVEKVSTARTARRLMEGTAYVPESVFRA